MGLVRQRNAACKPVQRVPQRYLPLNIPPLVVTRLLREWRRWGLRRCNSGCVSERPAHRDHFSVSKKKKRMTWHQWRTCLQSVSELFRNKNCPSATFVLDVTKSMCLSLRLVANTPGQLFVVAPFWISKMRSEAYLAYLERISIFRAANRGLNMPFYCNCCLNAPKMHFKIHRQTQFDPP